MSGRVLDGRLGPSPAEHFVSALKKEVTRLEELERCANIRGPMNSRFENMNNRSKSISPNITFEVTQNKNFGRTLNSSFFITCPEASVTSIARLMASNPLKDIIEALSANSSVRRRSMGFVVRTSNFNFILNTWCPQKSVRKQSMGLLVRTRN